MKIRVLAYCATAVIFLGLDSIWLSVMGDRLYRPLIGDLLRPSFDLVPAILFYGLYIGGIVIFVISPAIGTGRAATALWRGALFGLVAYATYDLTNQATLKNWPTAITLLDLSWGTVLTGLSASLGYVLARAASRRIGNRGGEAEKVV